MGRRELVLMTLITIFGAVLRFNQIGAQSLWFDELLSVTISHLDLRDTLTLSGAIDPPLYYFLLHFWMHVSTDDGWIRALSALFSIATIPAIFLLGRRLLGTRVGLIAATICALGPLQLYYAQEARMYALLVFFSTLCIWAYHRAQAIGRVRDWAVWMVLTALAIYSHIFGGVLLAALDLDALWRWHTERTPLRAVVFSNLTIAALMIPWMMLLLPQFGYLVGILWLTPPTILQPILTLDAFVFGYTLLFPFNVIALVFVVTALVFLLMSLWRVLRSSAFDIKKELRLLLLAAFFPLIFILLVSQIRSMYLDRWLLESSTAFYILLAWGIVASDRRGILRMCAVASLALVFTALYNYFAVNDFYKPSYREAIAAVVAQRTPGELVAHTSAGSFLAARFYDPLGNNILLYNPVDPWLTPALMDSLHMPFATEDARHTISAQKRYWLVVALDHIPEEQMAEKAESDSDGTVLEHSQIGGIDIYHYQGMH
jgi:mannosyltransferase